MPSIDSYMPPLTRTEKEQLRRRQAKVKTGVKARRIPILSLRGKNQRTR